jgi:uncharacterized coiled-coil protein SlyX
LKFRRGKRDVGSEFQGRLEKLQKRHANQQQVKATLHGHMSEPQKKLEEQNIEVDATVWPGK